uniref:Uncharacterized protein n=1 Tax=Oryza sativa subsp. japonica TaxID=39947 RepID=Q9AV24_ORYSJ|nr:hypothetical protein [Oryza sativa Japonica Group]
MEVLSQDWPIGLLMDVTASTARPGRVAVAGRHRWFNSPLSPTLSVMEGVRGEATDDDAARVAQWERLRRSPGAPQRPTLGASLR